MELFRKDNHASDTPTYAPANPVDTALIQALLRLYYPQIESLEVLSIGSVNINAKNFRVGPYYVKLTPATPDSALMLQTPSIRDCMHKRGIPVATFVPSLGGELVTTVPTQGERGAYYLYVQYFIPGHFYTGTKNELQEGLDLLKKQKGLFASITTSNWPKKPYLLWQPHALLTEAANLRSTDTTFDTAVHTALPILRAIADAFEHVRPALHFTECHHFDLHPHNLLFDEAGLRCVLDLESVTVVPYEIATLFNSFKLARKTIAMGHVPLADVRTMLAQHFDVKTLYPFAQYELLRRLCLVIQLHYKKNDTQWDQDLYKHLNGLKEVELLFGPAAV